MQRIHLPDLAEGVSSWSELEAQISALSSEIERGEVFEEFCKVFFLLDPVFQFEKVYRQNEIPPSLRQRLGYPIIQDIGIDGLAITIDGKLVAYQAKFRRNRNNIPTLRELSTFFTVTDRADWRITITNANYLPSAINDRTNHSRVLSDRFDQLEPDFFNRLRVYLKEQYVTPPTKKTPHETQQEAINEAAFYFKENNRGQLILPCGTGKTLAAMWVAEKLGGSHILVMVPSLALMSQTLREWASNTSLRPFHYLCLCSDTTVDLGNDSPIEHFYEMDIPVTTDGEVVSNFLANESSITSILFSTYQSSKVLSVATLKTGTIFDIAIFDEAHRTTGTKVGLWNIALDDDNVPIKKRIFMTATPRIYAPHIVKRAEEEDVLICSMDDGRIYGRPFYEMTFGKAIKGNLITDYKIVVICVTDSEVKEIIQHGGRVITDDDYEWDARAFAKRVALVKGINAYGLKKVFTFHGRVKGAKAFTDTSTSYGIHQIFKMLDSKNTDQKEVKFFHVNGTMSSGIRNSFMKEFKEAEIGIMSNARCLTEGVDVPTVDTVAFIDPKRSLIDIVQATGRAMRKAEWKERGYIFIPVVVDEDADPERVIESSDFKTVWQVLQSMVDQDQRLQDIVSNLRVMQGKCEGDTQAWRDAMSEYGEKIEFYNLPIKIDKARFINTLYTKTVEVIGKSWDFWYGLTLKYKEQFGDPNAPVSYKTPKGFTLGFWQDNQRQFYKKNQLNLDRIEKLNRIGFTWDPTKAAFEKGFQETLRYKDQTGNPNALVSYRTPEGYTLGFWQDRIRQPYKKGNLPLEYVKRLDEIGFVWNPTQEAFEKGFRETLRYKEQTGDPNAPFDYKTPEGFRLGSWQDKQRYYYKRGKLVPDREERLNEVGFRWVPLTEETFEKGLRETLKYKDQTGDPNALYNYRTPEGFNLGGWQASLREADKKERLTDDKVKLFKEIGFILNPYEEGFEKLFNEILKYKDQFGDPNAPQSYKTPEGYNLGKQLNTIRQKYKKGKMKSKRILRLEGIGFKWELKKRQK